MKAPNTHSQKISAALRQRWQALNARERRAVLLAAAVLAMALLWWQAIAPVLAVWRSAPAEHQRLDRDIATMQRLQTEAQQLQNTPTLTTAQARQQIEASLTQQLGGSATFSVLGERVTITFSNAPAMAVQRWLSQVRANAHAIPAEMRLTGDTPVGNATGTAPTWSGTLVLNLPAQ